LGGWQSAWQLYRPERAGRERRDATLLSCASAGRDLVMRDAYPMLAADLSANKAFESLLFEIVEPGQQAQGA
jgi:hypothetical protein